MQRITAIARRELAGYFLSPIAYVVFAVFAIASSFFFFQAYEPGAATSDVLRHLFGQVVQICVFVVPALSMRLIAEEHRSGAIELLMTAPVGDGQVVFGKWCGALAFLLLLLLVTVGLPVALVLATTSSPGLGQVLAGGLGLLLVGGLYLAVGMLASALTASQIIAWIVSVLVIGALTFLLDYLVLADWLSNAVREVIAFVSVNQQAADLNKGLIGLGSIVYFLAGTWMFLFLATKALESRRWR